MSHHAHQARAAHIRHAIDNRAGGFGGLGGLFTLPGITLPGLGFDPTTSTTKAQKTTTSKTTTTSSSTTTTSSSTTTSSVSTSSSVPKTSSSSSTVTTSSTSLRVTTTYAATALGGAMTVTHTHTTSATVAAVLASSSSSPSALSSTSSALVAPVIGGVAGGIVGLAALIFLVTFCIRRRSRKDMDEVNFDPGSFRRSAMLITDPPTHQDTVARGYNPPAPPPMMERRQMYPGSNHDGPNGDRSPTSGNPLIFQAPFSPITPVATSPVSAYDHSWPAPSPAAPVPVLTRTTPAKSATSNASSAPSPHDSAQYAQYPALPGPRNTLAVPQPENDYLDLERTSVTPFQAAQYVEISKRLNTDVPKGLETPEVEEFVATQIPIKDADLPPIPPNDPFTDDAAPNDEDEDEDETVTLPMVQELSFPAPPSPAHSTSSRHRVDSMPPTLPEIVVQSRVSVTSAYLSDAGSPFAPGFPSGQTVVMKGQESPMGNRFPVTPSPLASSFVVPSPPAATTTFPAAPAAVQPRPDAQGRQSVYTLYDPEDAYGGI